MGVAEPAWLDLLNTGHPLHIYEGSLVESSAGRWQVGTVVIRVAHPEEDAARAYHEWRELVGAEWRAWIDKSNQRAARFLHEN